MASTLKRSTRVKALVGVTKNFRTSTSLNFLGKLPFTYHFYTCCPLIQLSAHSHAQYLFAAARCNTSQPIMHIVLCWNYRPQTFLHDQLLLKLLRHRSGRITLYAGDSTCTIRVFLSICYNLPVVTALSSIVFIALFYFFTELEAHTHTCWFPYRRHTGNTVLFTLVGTLTYFLELNLFRCWFRHFVLVVCLFG